MKAILTPYISVAEMLVRTFGADCEVVLHDLDDPEHSVVYVANGAVTGRKVGDSFDQLVRQVILSHELREDYVANYYFTAKNGKRIRSSSLLIRGADGKGAVDDLSALYETLTRRFRHGNLCHKVRHRHFRLLQ